MANNEAHIKAVAKYNEANYKTISVRLSPEEHETLVLLAGRCGVGKSRIMADLYNRLTEEQKEELVKEYKKEHPTEEVE